MTDFETPSAPATPPPAEVKAEVKTDAKTEAVPVEVSRMAYQSAQERVVSFGSKFGDLQKSIVQMEQLKFQVKEGKADPKVLEKHGVTDEPGVQAKIDALKKEAAPHAEELGKAKTESDKPLSDIEKSGPAGKMEASLMRFNAAMNNPNATWSEKLAAVGNVIKDLKAMFKGLTDDIAGVKDAPGKGSEATGGTSKKKGDTVKEMLKDEKVTTLERLKDKKKEDRASLEKNKGDLTARLNGAKEDLARTESDERTVANAPADDPSREGDLQAAREAKAVAEAQVKAAETELATVDQNLKKITAEEKTLADVEDDTAKRLDAFNHGREAVTAKMSAVLDTLPVEDGAREGLSKIRTALTDFSAVPANNGVDLQIIIENKEEFLKPFADAKIDMKGLQINADGTIANPEGFLKAMEDLVTAAEKKGGGAKKEAAKEEAKPAAPEAAKEPDAEAVLADKLAQKSFDKKYAGQSPEEIGAALQKDMTEQEQASAEFTREMTAANDRGAAALSAFIDAMDPADPQADTKIAEKKTELYRNDGKQIYDKWSTLAQRKWGTDTVREAGDRLAAYERLLEKSKKGAK